MEIGNWGQIVPAVVHFVAFAFYLVNLVVFRQCCWKFDEVDSGMCQVHDQSLIFAAVMEAAICVGGGS